MLDIYPPIDHQATIMDLTKKSPSDPTLGLTKNPDGQIYSLDKGLSSGNLGDEQI